MVNLARFSHDAWNLDSIPRKDYAFRILRQSLIASPASKNQGGLENVRYVSIAIASNVVYVESSQGLLSLVKPIISIDYTALLHGDHVW